MPSTVIKSFTYDAATEKLNVVLRSGKVYDYFKVPAGVYEEMKASFSKGIFYNKHIKPHYAYKEVK